VTLAELGSLGEVVGAIGSVAALAYLALQIRQNTEGLRINSYHQATSELARLLDTIYSNPEFAEIFRRGSADPAALSEEERARFAAYLASFYYAYENLFELYERGRVEPEKWENAFVNALPLFRRPGIAEFGARRVGPLSQRFGAYLREYEPPAG
jgi:hypothetical protein